MPRDRSREIVVFELTRDSVCAECGEDLGKGRWLRLEGDRPLCMECVDLSRLVFLAAGDAALTRRAGRYSRLRAVVVRFSRARKRYERQGILVEGVALERAERECLSDAEARARRRERATARAAELDARYVTEFATAIGRQYPSCPERERVLIAEHACRRYSGRVGRTAAARRFEAEAIDLAVRAHVRHVHTEYEALVWGGLERRDARAAVGPEVERVLDGWRQGDSGG